MKTTEECINYISTHPWYKRKFFKLKNPSILYELLSIPSGDFSVDAHKINMFAVDGVKPKDSTLIVELATVCNHYRYNPTL